MNLLKKRIIRSKIFLNSSILLSFDFENDKRLMIKIGIKRRIEKEMKVPKKNKSNKETK